MNNDNSVAAAFTGSHVYEAQHEMNLPSGRLQVGIQCRNIPTDGFVEAHMLGPHGEPWLDIPKMPVHSPNMTVLYPFTLSEPFQGTMTIRYYFGSRQPGSDANVHPLALSSPEDIL